MRKYIVLFILVLFAACEEKLPTAQNFPIIRTLAADDVDHTGATFRAKLLRKGEAEITSYGFVWDTNEPDIQKSKKVVLGKELNSDSFNKRIDYALAKGLTYKIRAFVTFANKTVYGNTITLESQGSSGSPWSLVVPDVQLAGYFEPYGSSNGNNGHILYQSANAYVFNPTENKFTGSAPFPVQGNSGTKFTAVTVNNSQYFFNSINSNLYRLQNGSWSVQSTTPFYYGYFGGYYHGHASGNRIFILSSAQSYMYNLDTNSWQRKATIPISNGYSVGGVSLGDKAYVITTDKRIWEYNEGNDTWLLKTTYPGRLKERIVSFAHKNKIYFGLSYHDHHTSNNWMETQFWSYDPGLDKWELQELFPAKLDPAHMFFFPLQNRLYIGHGHLQKKLWMFDPSKAH